MGWIEKVKSIICNLKASGKSEKEIEQIVQQAADKATVGGNLEVKPIHHLFANEYMRQTRMRAESNFGIPAPLVGGQDSMSDKWIWINGLGVIARRYGIKTQDAVDAFSYAVAAQARYKATTESNNWRKMHGLPMRRKRRVRR